MTPRSLSLRLLEWLLVIGMALLALDVLWGVLSRFLLGQQSRWTEELAIFLLMWLSLLGAGLVYGEHGHLGVDYFVGKLDPAARKLSELCSEALVCFFTCFALVGGGWTLVSTTLADGSLSRARLETGPRLPRRAFERAVVRFLFRSPAPQASRHFPRPRFTSWLVPAIDHE